MAGGMWELMMIPPARPNLTRSVLRRRGVHGESVHLKCQGTSRQIKSEW
jgi:hypothetical protein